MLRALFVLAIIAAGLAYSLKGPFYVLLFYLWIAYFRPEQWLWWDFVSSLNLSFVVGVAVVISAVLFGEGLQAGIGPTLLFAFLGQSLLSTLLSPVSNYSWPFFLEFARAIVISYLLITLVNSEQRLRAVLVVIGLSVGLEGAKQGWLHFLLHPGAPNTNGSPLLGDNNGVAVGMLMLVPLLLATARTAPQWTERFGERFLAVGVLLRAVVTYSRGGFLASAALALHWIWRSKHKLSAMIVVGAFVAIAAVTLPNPFWTRMATIGDATDAAAETDTSTAGRLHFWRVAVDMASASPLVGIGHNGFNAMYNRYDSSDGRFGQDRSVHSAWFGVLAELGTRPADFRLIARAWVFRGATRQAPREGLSSPCQPRSLRNRD